MRIRFIIVFALLALIGCQPDEKQKVFFGGQIVNPSASSVRLYFGNRVLDTFLLNNNTRFYRNYDSLLPGIYKLEHIPDFTSVLLEPGDSMWVRINAADFQKSIYFSGRGASKNNFLTDIDDALGKETKFIASQYAAKPTLFKQQIDSLLREKKMRWIQMDSLNSLSPYAQKLTQSAYVYSYAGIRERYALLRGSNWDSIQTKDFFGYRKYLNYGENDLAFFEPYISYLINFLNKEALPKNGNFMEARQNTDFNMKRLKLIDKYIKGNRVRNNLARAVAYEEMLNFENHQNHDNFLNAYFKINSSPSYAKEITALHKDIKQMEVGKALPTVLLQNTQLDLISSDTIATRPTVLYFWSQTQMSRYKTTLERVQQLQKKHPEYRFIGISIQPLNPIALEVYKMMALDPKDQYAIADFGAASKKWVITLLNKTIILDSQGKIKNGFANLISADFEKSL